LGTPEKILLGISRITGFFLHAPALLLVPIPYSGMVKASLLSHVTDDLIERRSLENAGIPKRIRLKSVLFTSSLKAEMRRYSFFYKKSVPPTTK